MFLKILSKIQERVTRKRNAGSLRRISTKGWKGGKNKNDLSRMGVEVGITLFTFPMELDEISSTGENEKANKSVQERPMNTSNQITTMCNSECRNKSQTVIEVGLFEQEIKIKVMNEN